MGTKADGDSSVRAGERFAFHDLYLGDPYPFFAEARGATPVFYSPDLDYGVVTRYHDIRQIFFVAPRGSRSTLAGVKGTDRSRTPIASKTAFAMAAGTAVGSPATRIPG